MFIKKLLGGVVILCILALNSGCVRRVVTLNSQPQGARVYFDRKLVGRTPCEFEFLYYGGHYLELAKNGYTNLNTTLKLKGPFYEYFPLSVFSELLIPWEIVDKHNFSFTLETGESRKPIITTIEQPQPPLSGAQLERIKEK